MFEIIVLVLVLVVVLGALALAVRLFKNPNVTTPEPLDEEFPTDDDVRIAGDEDIKIAGEHFAEQKHTVKDSADEAAKEFLKHKESGKIKQAGQIGELLAGKLWKDAQDLIMRDDAIIGEKDIHQQIVLKSYTTNIYITEETPDTILAETTISIFFDKIEELSKVLYKHVSDTAAFSLYILNYRSSTSQQEVGQIYAKLCGNENNPEKIEEGNRMFAEYYEECKQLVESFMKEQK